MSEPSLSGLKTIILEARTLTGAARHAYLDRMCGDSPELRQEIESLLAFESAVPSLLDDDGLLRRLKAKAGESPTRDLDVAAANLAPADAPGEQVGPYRLVELIGEGGMGVVYRAEQVTPIRREVALKLIRRGLDTDRVVARFDSERQALARMEHPAIARVLDAGASADGRPYFVMELVQGAPITEFCDRERLTLAERIALAIAVCQAVQHAHQKGIIHRDLKPSNILVSRQDGTAVPKVIDFGIAKAVAEPLTDYTLLTRVGQFIGTPDYMSPEQAGVLAVDVDTRTDVYALGVLLYELLAGRRPHQFERRTQDEIQQILRHEQPERPSTGLTGRRRRRLTRPTTVMDEATRARIAHSRRTTADRLRRQLAGDLDNIVLKAMQKEPARRYGSAEQLGDDLQRYLDGKPVLARPDTWTYRTGKFARRHALAVAAAASALLLLVTFAVLTAIQSARVTRERDRALAAEQRARSEAETASQVSNFLVGLFRVSDPQEAQGNTLTAREILDRGAERIGRELAGKPRVQGKLLQTMGVVYKQLGMYDDAARLMAQAVAARERGAPDELEDSLNELGDIERYRGRLAEAEPLLRRALDLRRRQFGPADIKVGQALNNLALVFDEAGKYREAEAAHREALRLRKAALGPRDAIVSNSLSNLGITLRNLARYDEAEQVLREALSIRRERFGAEHPLVANTANSLGNVLSDTGRYAAAEPLFREALAIRRKVLPPAHPNLAVTLSALAGVLQDQDRLDQAAPLYLEALTIERGLASGPDMPVAQTLNNLATLYEQRGEYSRAEGMYQESLVMRRALRGARHPAYALALGNLARLRLAAGRLASAERLAREALALRIELLGERHAQTSGNHVVLGRVLQARGALAPAEEQFRKALLFCDAQPPPPADHPTLLLAQLGLGRVLLDRHRPAEAEPLARAVLAARTKRFPNAADWRVGEAQVVLGRALLDQRRLDDAAPLLASGNRALAGVSAGQQALVREAARASVQLQQARSREGELALAR